MTAADSRDHPLSCNWRPTDPDAFAILNLPPTRSKAAAIARTQMIAEAFVVGRADPGAWISYSRRRAFYAARQRYWPVPYSHDTVVPTVDQLAALGIVEHQKAATGERGWQSRFKASVELIQRLSAAPVTILHDPRELIVLRDDDGSPIDYRDTDRTNDWRRHLNEINEAILATAIGIWERTVRDGDPLRVGGRSLGVVRNSLHRVFNRGSFSLGGRFYGPWCQNIPQDLRPFITIDERPTIELDYPRLHPTLLYAEADQRLCGDAYEISGWDRRLVKIAFNTLVNADTRVAAIRSIAREIGGQGAYRKAEQLVQAIEAKHQPIASAFGTGAGLRLMRRDSGMTERIMLQLVRKGVVVLPIHDSYIVSDGTKTKGELMEAMASALHRFAGKSAVGAGPCTKNIPQYGDKSVASSVAVFVFFPDLRQRDFFGGDRLAVPASDVLEWRGGIAPPGVRTALHHEKRRRGLRQSDVARLVGLSRPQLSNLQHGRFGASPEAAARIRDFLIDGAKTVGGSP
jgi:hypothetical protein